MSPFSRWASLGSIAAFVLVAALSLQDLSPPAPVGRDAPPEAFSAERAFDLLARILVDGRPHPTGSPANAAVRDRILVELERIGYEPEVRRRFVCGVFDSCATVENILAVLPGTGGKPGVLLTAHYDSVAAGPGAGDDGAGVAAILETARALRAGPDLPRSVWFLLGDGEEAGLLSAEAFVLEPEFDSIGSVVNLEARGTEGPSQLFETQTGNAAIVALAREALPNPVGSSLAYEIYKHMPNNTDFTVFRREGLAGVNFAFTGGPTRYHTPRDNLDHLDPGSLQHHGENALAMALALATTEDPPTAAHDSVFFDLFGETLVGWPAGWNAPLLALGVIGWLALAVRSARRGYLRPLRLAAVSLLLPLLPVAALAVAIGLQALLASTNGAAASWTATGQALVFAFLILAVAVCALAARPMQRWAGDAALALAALFTFALLAVVAAIVAPGASFLALLPLIAGVAAGHAVLSKPVLWGGAAAVFTAMLWFVFAYLSYEALGYSALAGITLLMTIALLPLLPAFAGLARGGPLIAGAALICMTALAALSAARPAFTEDVPQHLNLLYAGNEEGGRLLAEAVASDLRPADLMRLGGFDPEPVESLPWSDRRRLAGRAGPALPAPELTVLRDMPTETGRSLRLNLRSQRGARVLYLVLPTAAGPESVRVEGHALEPPPWVAGASRRTIVIVAPPEGGVQIDVELGSREAFAVYAADASEGLPPDFAEAVDARNAAAVPADRGDLTLAWHEVRLPAL